MSACIGCTGLISLTACGSTDSNGTKIDQSRTQLYVSNYDGGFGSEWLDAAAARFEKLYADKSFQQGRMGVQIVPVNAKKNGDQIMSEMLTTSNDVFFCENVPYREAVLSDYFLDITDAVTKPLSDFGESGTIEAKLTEQQRNWFNMDGKYYAIPHYEGYYGMFYDVDTFDERKLFFDDSGNFTNYAGRGNGADGTSGTYDDGLPVNTTQFFKLLDEMKRQEIEPVAWPGKYKQYASYAMNAYHMQYEGIEQAMLNYTLNGEAKTLITIGGDGVPMPLDAMNIDETNAYELQRQAGNYYALDWMERIIDGKYYYLGCFNQSQTHLDNQEDFLLGAYEKSKKEIGILFDGTWWENEANSTFEEMAKRYNNAGKYDRRFGVMPFPMPDGTENGNTVLLDYLASTSFVNSKVPEYKKQLAIDFVRFCATDESLTEFTKITNTLKAFNYTLQPEDIQELTYFGQQVWNLKENSNIIYKYSSTPKYYKNQTFFNLDTSIWNMGTQNIPVDGLLKGTSAAEYFNGIYNTRQKAWGNLK